MSQISDIQSYSIEDILKILHSEAHKLPLSPTSLRYLQALRSLTATLMVGTHGSCVREPSSDCVAGLSSGETSDCVALKTQDLRLKTSIADWLVSQWLLGVPFSTASLNLDIISALYGAAVRQDLLPKTDLFSQLKVQLKELGPQGWKTGINEEIFARALRLTKNAHRLLLDDSIAADLLLLSLNSFHRVANTAQADTSYSPLTPIEQLALLTRDPHAKSQSKKGDDGGEESSRSRSLLPGEGSAAEIETFASLHEVQDLAVQDEQLLETVIARHAPNARKKYIFPLDQSKRSEAVIKKQVFRMTNALFRRARLPQSTDPNQTIESLWAYAALRTGLPATAVVAALGHAPLGLPVLKLSVVSCQLSESAQAAKYDIVGTHGSCVRESSRECAAGLSMGDTSNRVASDNLQLKTENLAEVGKVFLDNPARWYAMSLRPGVRFTQVCRRIELLTKPEASNLKPEALSLFYPCEEIARAIGKKIVIKQRPFIHSVVFFKAKLTDIGPLFARIGDLAWCYRQSARPGAPYADISERQFRQFQQTIARFTPDYEVAPAGELDLKPNDRVEIVGGLFAGQTATVVGTHGSCVRVQSGDRAASEDLRLKTEDSHTIYRLNIIGENGIEWRIRTDSRLLKPTPK